MNKIMEIIDGKICFVSKGESMETDNVIKIFHNSPDWEEIKRAIQGGKERLFASWDTVEYPDNTNEQVEIDDELDNVYKTYIYKRGGAISDGHTNRIIGKTLTYKITTHPETGKKGILTLNRVHDDYPYDDNIWGRVQSGEIGGVSVGGQSNKEASKDDRGGILTKLKNLKVWEKALTPRPCLTIAKINAFSFLAKEDIDKKVDDLGEKLNIDWEKVDREQLKKGIEVESEHGSKNPETNITNDDLEMTAKIALAHINEIPDYYDKLAEMESSVKKAEIKKPFADYENFDACVADQKSKGHPEESANKICGKLKHELEDDVKKELEDKVDNLERIFLGLKVKRLEGEINKIVDNDQ